MSESIKHLSDDELAAAYYVATDADDIAAMVTEMDRRERKAAERAAKTAVDKARWARVNDEWMAFAHAQYLAAEAECKGNLVRRNHLSEITDGWSLWSGSHKWAWERATDELREFWDANKRITVSEYREGLREANREARRTLAAAA